MATFSTFSSTSLLKQSVLLLLNILLGFATISPAFGCYTSIFSFGDSLADTGNLLCLQPDSHCGRLPYGETYFHRPNGRCSDGLLIVDFIAQSLGLPFVPPIFGVASESSRNLRTGVNFAVVGDTALDAAFFQERGIHSPYTNSSLRTQLDSFKQMLPSLCSTSSDCAELLSNSLILMGEIGGNDYNNPFFQRRSAEEIREFVPQVVDVIVSAINEMVELGAVTFLVPGNFPIGCLPSYLTLFQTSNKEEYDSLTGCLNWLNEFSEYHNEKLQTELNRFRELHPHVNIIYADYYNAAMCLYRSPNQFGFIKSRALIACCGAGGPYNYNSSVKCSNSPSTSCDDPSLYISWDGIHFTQAAYRWIYKGLFEGPYTIPHIDTSCISVSGSGDFLNKE